MYGPFELQSLLDNLVDSALFSVTYNRVRLTIAHCLKITQNVAFEFLILAFSTNFCLINSGLSGNTV